MRSARSSSRPDTRTGSIGLSTKAFFTRARNWRARSVNVPPLMAAAHEYQPVEHFRALFPHRLVDLHAGRVGHHDVAEDQIEHFSLPEVGERVTTAADHRDGVTSQDPAERTRDQGLVVHYQDANSGHLGSGRTEGLGARAASGTDFSSMHKSTRASV